MDPDVFFLIFFFLHGFGKNFICEFYVAKDIIIMEFEGTDGVQRQKYGDNFERQTSLMALALSEVLMVNISYSDIGKHAAFNQSTLRSIFEANLGLFTPKSKTLIIFLIHDYDVGAYLCSKNNTKINLSFFKRKVLFCVFFFGYKF